MRKNMEDLLRVAQGCEGHMSLLSLPLLGLSIEVD